MNKVSQFLCLLTAFFCTFLKIRLFSLKCMKGKKNKLAGGVGLKKQSAVPTSSCDEPPGKQARRNPAALINNILWIISKIKYIL